MTINERIAINERIDVMIGSRESKTEFFNGLELAERIAAKAKYENLREKLMKIAEKSGEKALTLTLIDCGGHSKGTTVKGKKFVWTQNQGVEIRSRYCGSLWLEGVGTVFTSGTVAKVFEYVLNN